ncbi:MAG: UvrD-helicase domain-containing protein, partial [Rhodocyclaceae bacterium]
MPNQLNAPQNEAIHYLDGPLLVLAGAGSGKTRVITRKIAYLVEQCGYTPAHIAAITFTNKAAREMQARASKLLPGKSVASLNVSTFHSLGVRILRAEAAALGLKPRFSILDAADAYAIVAELSKESDKARIRRLQTTISSWKNALVGPDAALTLAQDELELAAARLYGEYERALKAYQAVDFDDLIRLPVALFEANDEVLTRWQGRLRYLLVDEYQDTNRSQYRLLRLLAGPRAAFTAVGDDDQAIYAWRGADSENLHRLSQDYPTLKVIKLEQNYRSTTRILAAANTLIANNPKMFEKKLWSQLGHGDVIRVSACRDAEQEAEQVVMRLSAHKFEHRAAFRDYAILYRGNHQARLFEQQLRAHKIPYLLSGGQSFFERAEIKDVTAYLRLIANSDDDPAFIRAVTTPRRGIGAQTLEALGRYAGSRHVSLFAAAFEAGAASHLPSKQLDAVLEFGNFINRMEWRGAREPAGAVLEDLLRAIGYETFLFDT